MTSEKIYLIALFVFLVYLMWESFSLTKSLNKVPVKILVNGTRGKSTLVKMLTRILRQNGLSVYSKTTGDSPQLHYPDGTTKTIKRFAPAGILENIRHLRMMAKNQPDAVVLECNALLPENQLVLSKHIFKPNYVLLTNILPDHHEIMGDNLYKNAHSIAGSFYPAATLVTTNETHTLLKESGIHTSNISANNISKLPSITTKIPLKIVSDQWQILDRINNLLNLDKVILINEFKQTWREIEKLICLSKPGKHLEIWNLFSVNDALSSDKFITSAIKNHSMDRYNKSFLINCRHDRPLRTKDFIDLISTKYRDSTVYITGQGKHLARRLLKKKRVPDSRIINTSVGNILQILDKGFKQNTLIFLLGNSKNMHVFLNHLIHPGKQN